jgi:hypothetical protein
LAPGISGQYAMCQRPARSTTAVNSFRICLPLPPYRTACRRNRHRAAERQLSAAGVAGPLKRFVRWRIIPRTSLVVAEGPPQRSPV